MLFTLTVITSMKTIMKSTVDVFTPDYTTHTTYTALVISCYIWNARLPIVGLWGRMVCVRVCVCESVCVCGGGVFTYKMALAQVYDIADYFISLITSERTNIHFNI